MSDPTEIISKLLDEAASVAGLIFATWAFARLRKARRDINAAFQKIRVSSTAVAPTAVTSVAHDPSGVEVHVGEVTVRVCVSTTTASAPAAESAPDQRDQDRDPQPVAPAA